MPNGPAHAAYANGAAKIIVVTSAAAAITYHPIMLGVAAGGLVGLLVDPDLDHHKHTQSEQRVWRYNHLLGRLWSLYWTPYDWTHPHRGSSHTWPTGTLGRFVYALWLPMALSLWYSNIALWLCWWALVFVGLSLQDGLHLWLDEEL